MTIFSPTATHSLRSGQALGYAFKKGGGALAMMGLFMAYDHKLNAER